MKKREEEEFTFVSSYVTTSSERSWPRRGGLLLRLREFVFLLRMDGET